MAVTTAPAPARPAPLDPVAVRRDFPILAVGALERPIVYLDSAATAQKPRCVLAAMDHFYETANANVHRGAYWLAERATEALESSRRTVARFVGAADEHELIFTRNATEALNLVAHSYGRRFLKAGDVVLLSHMEHHANIVPWQQLAADHGVTIRWIPLTAEGELDLSDLDALLDGVRLVGVSAQSNVLGTLPPVRYIADAAHAVGAVVALDACQYVPHHHTDFPALGADFAAFSAHKMLGPTGIGALWGRVELLEAMPPFLGGGQMITNVTLDGFTPAEVPWRFEAGTPAIAEAVGFAAAADYLSALGMDRVASHEQQLSAYALSVLGDRHGESLKIFGPTDASARGGLASFTYKDVHAHDLSQVLDNRGVCVRAGHHCAKPLLKLLGVPALTRASWYVYNTEEDIDILSDAIADADSLFF